MYGGTIEIAKLWVLETPTRAGILYLNSDGQSPGRVGGYKTGLDKFFVNKYHRETTEVCTISEPAQTPPVVNGENQRLNSIQGKIDKLECSVQN